MNGIHHSLGESGDFHLRQGHHVDLLRDSIFETLPPGWREPLLPVPECEGAFALEPHDPAATKLLVGREKDIALVRHLHLTGRLSRALLEQRLDSIPKTERLIAAGSATLVRASQPTLPNNTDSGLHYGWAGWLRMDDKYNLTSKNSPSA